jgi:hypothetical protein
MLRKQAENMHPISAWAILLVLVCEIVHYRRPSQTMQKGLCTSLCLAITSPHTELMEERREYARSSEKIGAILRV